MRPIGVVIRKFNNKVGGLHWCAVMGIETIEEWTLHTALGGSGVKCEWKEDEGSLPVRGWFERESII
ncbi:hypothetical protein EXN66_Car020493 [Channa argus]|uniref:Uncharacterized protein n=1 Tax=Channa argus TaxID=215402 RepID=A0A6G1QR79_CHAAH|nr:hypothetical protein EXN66_Car020493 [Channa argus]